MPELTPAAWDAFLTRHPQAHLLQTTAWGELKTEFGWRTARLAAGEAGAQVLFRPLPLGFTIAYLPKGPLGAPWQALWPELDRLCRRNRAIFLEIEPDLWESDPGHASHFPPPLFRPSPHPIQPPRTLVIDLQDSEEALLARMKQKTRYNIRLAQKKGIVVRLSGDLAVFNTLIEETGARDAFSVHSPAYYRSAYERFHPHGACEMLVAEFEGQPLAALMIFTRGKRAWYFYGASSNEERSRMPTYLLQWEAIRWARRVGATEYDLWGVPDAGEETLETQFTTRADGLWGVYRFKRGFGGELRRASGPWDRVYLPPLYTLYRRLAR